MDALVQNLTFACRQLLRQPLFTVVVLLTLALGIGSTTAMFTVMDGVLLRPLPYPSPERLVGLEVTEPGSQYEKGLTWREAQQLIGENKVFESVGAATSLGVNLFVGDASEHLHELRVTHGYFRALGIAPARGRGFSAEEDQVGGPATVVLSDALWRRRFGADPHIVGSVVRLDGEPHLVIGVMPPEFHSIPDADLYSTLAQVASTVGSGQNLQLVARLKPGLTITQANAGFAGTLAAFRTEFPEELGKEATVALRPMQELVSQDVASPVRLLFGAIAFVLLIACANVANLLMGKAAGRTREFAVRVALGASRARVIRQLLTESVMLALLGGALGVLLGDWLLRLMLVAIPNGLPRMDNVHLDGRAFLFAGGLSVLTGVAFGLLPAIHAGRTNIHDELREGSGRSIGSRRNNLIRNGLVVAEVALSLVLLVGAGLLLRTFVNLMREDPGFDPRGVVSAEIWLTGSRYQGPEAISGFYEQVTTRLKGIPGVQAAAVVEAGMPLERGGNIAVGFHGQPAHNATDYRTVTEGYFATLGTTLRSGRLFGGQDQHGTLPVVVVNARFATKYLTDGSPIGQTIHVGGKGGLDPTVIGVVSDVRSFVGQPAPPTVFLLSAQTPADFTRVFNGWFPIHVLVRTTGSAESLGAQVPELIRSIDPAVPVGSVRTLPSVLSESLAYQRFILMLLALFGGVAVMLAAIGLYGVIGYLVAQRSREIGVRLALGAGTGQVIRMVVFRGLGLALLGGGVGLVGAVALTRLLRGELYGVTPTDPLTLALVTLLLLMIATVASAIPAFRAARLDPLVALRSD